MGLTAPDRCYDPASDDGSTARLSQDHRTDDRLDADHDDRPASHPATMEIPHRMIPLTRAEALTQARTELGRYTQQLADSQPVSRDYVFALGRAWDRRLAALGRLGADLPVAPETVTSLLMLSRELHVPDLDADAAIRWLDVFPDSVADLFPPSAVTFRLLDEQEEEDAGSVASARSRIAAAA